jgi:hypothetical protein
MNFKSEEDREKVLSQLKEVRDSGQINTFDASGVQRVAYDQELYALVRVLGDRPSKNYGELLDEFEDWLDSQE